MVGPATLLNPREAALLNCLLSEPDRQWSGPEIRERTDLTTSTFSRTVGRLEKLGLVEVHGAGPAKTYRIAQSSPLYEPVRELLERTVGVEALLSEGLAGVRGVDVAAIFGSWANREKGLRPTSDVDVLVVGDADFNSLVDVAAAIEPLAGREISIVAYSWPELRERVARDSGFVRNVIAGPLTPLVGDVSRLEETIP